MKQFIFYFFIFIMLISLINRVSAVGFSPGNLVYKLPVGTEQCQTISFSSDSEISISDKWAEDKTMEWKVSYFDKPALFHGLTIKYPEKLSLDQRQAQVCLSGKQPGEYHGVVILREEQKGSSIIQMGIWIKAIIGSDQEIATAELNKTNKPNKNITINLEEPIIDQNNQDQETNLSQSSGTVVVSKDSNPVNLITGAFIGTNHQINYKTISIILISIIIIYIIILIFKKNRRPSWERKYY